MAAQVAGVLCMRTGATGGRSVGPRRAVGGCRQALGVEQRGHEAAGEVRAAAWSDWHAAAADELRLGRKHPQSVVARIQLPLQLQRTCTAAYNGRTAV